ncbi:MAG TPA: dephospho-CoA kinase [Verrucomicrobiota bacterium]|nr:dephospho-CoA kinase [Verrucomicrobiota bacterium]
MVVLGITGGIGTGKTTIGELLKELGVKVIDTDCIAREVVKPGEKALEEVYKTFGSKYFNSDGTLNRPALAGLVFKDENARKMLESILHPEIRKRWLACVQQWENDGVKFAAVIVPLLFETEAQNQFNAVICVACLEETRIKRLIAKGWDKSQIEARTKAQLPLSEKMNLSDFVIWNEFDLDITKLQLIRVLRNMSSYAGI